MARLLNKTYDVIIVGAGPAGIFCALKLVDLGIQNILLLDRGKDIFNRRRKGRDIVSGWGGAGAFSDGKITLSPEVGGFLGDYLDRESLLKVLDEADGIYLKYGAPQTRCDLHRKYGLGRYSKPVGAETDNTPKNV